MCVLDHITKTDIGVKLNYAGVYVRNVYATCRLNLKTGLGKCKSVCISKSNCTKKKQKRQK